MSYCYWHRDLVNERLRLGRSQSYAIMPKTATGRIRSDCVVMLLNRSRRGVDAPLDYLPSDLMTPEEAAQRYADSGITLGDIRRWTRRKRRIPPHFRLSQRTILFSAAMLDKWLEANSSPTKGACT